MNISLIEQDKQDREHALDARKSFIVQAPAGSGKTELLIQRFLTLLAEVSSPEEILAITFTKKAANEMRLRVIKALSSAAYHKAPDSEHALKTWRLARNVLLQDKKFSWNLIDNPNQLRIQTIDSFCSTLTKQLPLLSHFGSQPEVCDQPEFLYREAVQEILMHVEENYEWSQAITLLLMHLDNDLNKLHELMTSLLAKRDQWLPYIQLCSNDKELRAQLESQLSQVISETLSNIAKIFPKDLIPELTAIAHFAASHVQPESNLRLCESLTALPGTSAKDKNIWHGLATLLLTKSFSWRKRVDEDTGFPPLKSFKNPGEIALHTEFRQRFTALVVKLSDNENLRELLTELFYLPDESYTDTQWDILLSLLHVLKIAAAQLRLTFQQYGQIDFVENTQAALIALGNDENATDLALSLDYHIRHILIDEFQDTSYTQYQLLQKLTQGWEKNDGRTLFIVGDPMQSIYRFREAEVGLFIRMRKHGIHHIKLTPLTLAVNFRSTPAIVEWNNLQFSQLFPSFNDMAKGAVSYSASASHQQGKTNDKCISIRGFVNASHEVEADNIIELINQTNKNYPEDKIAILVRSRPHLASIIPALKKAKIPYWAIDIDPLASRQHIQDLLSLTCALLHPADRIAWLSVLRAPWCGLSLADLIIVAGSDAYSAIYSQLDSAEILGKLSDDGRLRINKIFPILKTKMSMRERYHLRAFVESTWLLLGGPAQLDDYADREDVNAYFKLLDEFGQKNQVLNIDKLKERINRLYASTQHENANVHIMTIHTAKGLEFDTVILPQLSRKMPNDDKPLMQWMEQPLTNENVALLLAPIHATGMEKDRLYEYINRQQKIKTDYEIDRLFYVATTRAKKRLHLFFNATRNDKGDDKIESGSFISKIWPQLESSRHEILTVINNKDDARLSSASRPVKRLKSSWANPLVEITLIQSAQHANNGFKFRDHTPRLIGTTTHRILQIISLEGINWWTSKPDNSKLIYIQSMLKQLGLSTEHAIQAVYTAIKNTIADDRGKWILSPHRHAKSEFAISALIDNQVQNLVVDRTFIDENNILWIIDYKTALLLKLDLPQFLEKEKKKYQEQMHIYSQALSMQHDGEIRMGLYFPALPAWTEVG